MKRRLLIKCSIIFFLAISIPQSGMLSGFERFESFLDKFEFLPNFHLKSDIMLFKFHKDSLYRSRYFIETNSDLEFILVDYKQLIYSVWYLYVRTGMGRQDELVIFDPRDSRYGLIPSLELRLKKVNLAAGLEHFCFHDIDRDDGITEYWNKPYIDVASKNSRLGEYRKGLITEEKWDFRSRFSYWMRYGYYWHTLFGLMEESIIGGGHDYKVEPSFEFRYAFYKRLSWLVNARLWINYNYTRSGNFYQTYAVGLESHFRRGRAGSMLFMNFYPLDQLTVRPKDKLIEFGFRFYL